MKLLSIYFLAITTLFNPKDSYSQENFQKIIDSLFTKNELVLRGGFKAFPIQIYNYADTLEYLDLSFNEFQYLPENIDTLKKLTYLAIDYSYLKTLPNSIGNLRNLKHLSLLESEITELPESIGNLQNLEILNLNSNHLKILPKSIYKLQNLKKLYLGQMGDKESLFSLPQQEYIRKKLPNCDVRF